MLPSEWVNDGFRHTYNRMDGRFFDCAQNDRATNGRACEIQSTIPKIHRRTIRKTKPLHARPDCHAEEAARLTKHLLRRRMMPERVSFVPACQARMSIAKPRQGFILSIHGAP